MTSHKHSGSFFNDLILSEDVWPKGSWTVKEQIPMLNLSGMSLIDFFSRYGRSLLKVAVRSGAVKLRGCALAKPDEFAAALLSAGFLPQQYIDASTPRTSISKGVFTSTEYPKTETIPLHNELSYSRYHPRWVVFYGAKAPAEGGETTLAKADEVYQKIPVSIRSEFECRQVLYVRNCRPNMGLHWRQVFGTEDRDVIEQIAKERELQVRWLENNRCLRMVQKRPSVLNHEVTGARVWFNQAHLFHHSALRASVRESLLELYPDPMALPRTCFFGDGKPIPNHYLQEIRCAFQLVEKRPRWETGDVLLVDNQLMAHGRRPFSGPRKIWVILADRALGE